MCSVTWKIIKYLCIFSNHRSNDISDSRADGPATDAAVTASRGLLRNEVAAAIDLSKLACDVSSTWNRISVSVVYNVQCD